MNFEGRLEAIAEGGVVEAAGNQLQGARSNRRHASVHRRGRRGAPETRTYTATARAPHRRPSQLCSAASTCASPRTAADAPTDERLARFEANPDPSLLALYFQYGRYLLIASSRPGTQPANLQGIWNDQVRPPWSSNWTANINAQMNYWPAETCNLSECHEPLFGLIEELAVNGAETARVNYGLPGWCRTTTSICGGRSAPVGDSAGLAHLGQLADERPLVLRSTCGSTTCFTRRHRVPAHARLPGDEGRGRVLPRPG